MSAIATIQINSLGNTVKLWQSFLSSKGYSVGVPDGIFGPETATATKAFQTAQRLTADGIVGSDTYAAAITQGFTIDEIQIADFIGIDVYHANGNINWDEVKTDPQNIHFVYVKATEGTTIQDDQYVANIQGATAAGFATGAYHFFSLTTSAQTQAANFIETVGESYPYKLPPAFDYEVNVDADNAVAVIASVTIWLETVKSKWGITPVIYTSVNYWSQLNNPTGFDQYPLWLANYNQGLPSIPGDWSEWAIWQNSGNGSVNGISGYVDLNKYNIGSNLL